MNRIIWMVYYFFSTKEEFFRAMYKQLLHNKSVLKNNWQWMCSKIMFHSNDWWFDWLDSVLRSIGNISVVERWHNNDMLSRHSSTK